MVTWYIDTNTQRIWRLPIRSPVTDFRFERGSAEPIAVRFVTDGTVVELGGSATVTLGFKQTPTSTGYIIPSVTATKTGTGTSTVYTALPTFLSTDLDTYLSTADSKSVYMQVQWVDGTTTAQTPLCLARVSSNVNRGGETVPTVGGIKVYHALITQSGTSAPTATVLLNTLGGTVVWTRNSEGNYTGTLAAAFTVNKTPRLSGISAGVDVSTVWQVDRIDANSVRLQSATNGIGGDLADDLLSATFIEIPVYP